MEAQDLAKSGWDYTSPSNYITLSFWVRASVTQTYYVSLTTLDGTAQHYSFAISLTADTWTKIEKTIPGNSNITINNDNGLGFQIDFVSFFGTNFTDSGFTVDAWAAFSGSSRFPDFATSWANTTNATFDLTGVQLEVGSKATSFEHRSYNDERMRCMRYYESYWQDAGGTSTSYSSRVGTSQGYFIIGGFKVPKRAVPNCNILASNTAMTYFTDHITKENWWGHYNAAHERDYSWEADAEF